GGAARPASSTVPAKRSPVSIGVATNLPSASAVGIRGIASGSRIIRWEPRSVSRGPLPPGPLRRGDELAVGAGGGAPRHRLGIPEHRVVPALRRERPPVAGAGGER